MPPARDQTEQLIDQLTAFDILGRDRQKILAPLLPLMRQMELSIIDYMTIRDLTQISGCQGDEALIAVLMTLFAALQEGSLCLELSHGQRVDFHPTDFNRQAAQLMQRFNDNLSKGKYDNLISTNGHAYLPLVLIQQGDTRLLYFEKYYHHEKRLNQHLEAFLNMTSSDPPDEVDTDAVIDTLFSDQRVIRVGPDHVPIARDPHQVEALRLALGSSFTVISGGPGSGKTSLVVNLLRCLARSGTAVSRIIIAAPTGRAAQRMTEAIRNSLTSIQQLSPEDTALIDLKGSTLHKVLGYIGHSHRFYYRDTNPLPASVVIIDEVSMVDVVMLDQFLGAIDPKQTKLILLGDQNQLPSVEAGAILADMSPEQSSSTRFKKHFVTLQKIYRSGTNLLDLARQVNQGALPAFSPVGMGTALAQAVDQWAIVRTQSTGLWRQDLQQWMRHHYLEPVDGEKESYAALIAKAELLPAGRIVVTESGQILLRHLFNLAERARILTLLRVGPQGCLVINELIARQLAAVIDPAAAAAAEGFSGALILITRNDYSKNLFNGDVGILIKDADQNDQVYFQRAGSFTNYPLNLLPSWEYAFAITVHKSQGSEFDDILLVLPDDVQHRSLTRQVLYTGLTRARQRIIVYGSQDALQTALQRKIIRQSGLRW
jgi:exodeoxyribonuclease V alpha subunit